MSVINVRNKGASGEREFCDWIKRNLILPELNSLVQRNLEQVRSGGADIIVEGLPFAFEVKRVESLALHKWWSQVIRATTTGLAKNLIPVVAFRQNKKDWEFLISAEYLGCEYGFVHITEPVFIQWANNLISNTGEI